MGSDLSKEIQKFNSELEELREKTFKGKDSFNHNELDKYNRQVVTLYNTHLGGEIKKPELGKISNPFFFKNLSFDYFSWESFFNGFNLPEGHVRKNFSKEIIFEKCKITKSLFSNSGIFGDRLFSLRFRNCTIEGATFHLHSMQNVKEFRAENTSFNEIVFSYSPAFADFYFDDGCTFTSKIECENSCSFNIISFFKCKFLKGENRNSRISFNNTKFANTTIFEFCEFYSSPKFHNAEIHSDTSFHGSKFFDISSEQAVADYRILKQKLHEIGDEQQSLEFHAIEMDSRRSVILKASGYQKRPAYWASNFLKGLNDYGRNYTKPFLWLLFLTCLCFLIYLHFDGIGCQTYSPELRIAVDTWFNKYCDGPIAKSFIHALSMSSGPFGLIFEPKGVVITSIWTKIFSIIQTILSSVIWFLVVVQYRRQFKLG